MKKLVAGVALMKVGLIRAALTVMLGLAGVFSQAQAQTEVPTVGDAEAGAGKTGVCVACHGESGNDSSLPNVPKIGGQNAKYLLKQLIEIKETTREVPEMTGILANLDGQDLADLAAYYAEQEAPRGAAVPEMVELGEEIYRAGIPDIGVAACAACHSPTGRGNEPAGYPMLSGQLAAYTEKQLRDFRTGFRNNDDAAVMRAISDRMSDDEINAVASYVSGLR